MCDIVIRMYIQKEGKITFNAAYAYQILLYVIHFMCTYVHILYIMFNLILCLSVCLSAPCKSYTIILSIPTIINVCYMYVCTIFKYILYI